MPPSADGGTIRHAWQTPTYLGPSWQRGPDGRFLVPELTLGWHAVWWAGRHLQNVRKQPWVYTSEQFRLMLWWYAIDSNGNFVYRDGVLQRLKGWGKDPFAGTLCGVELVGPSRPILEGGYDGLRPVLAGPDNPYGIPPGQPLGEPHPAPWVQVAAVSKDQTRNTMRIFTAGMFSDYAKAKYSIEVGKELVYAHKGAAVIEAVTSSPSALEGGRSTFVVMNETHHWRSNNDGHAMADVIERNTVKSEDGAARSLAITNAFEPSQDSVAQRAREAYEQMVAGTTFASGTFYDSIEAHPDAPMGQDKIRDALGKSATDPLEVEEVASVIGPIVESVRGDSTWLNTPRIVKSILDPRNPVSRSRRFWYNQVTASEDSWADPQEFEALKALFIPGKKDQWALFLDASKSDDATGLVGCRISDGFIRTLGMWQKPPGERGEGWTVNRAAVNLAVEKAWEDLDVVAFFGDPSHTKDDETQERFWDDHFDGWHRKYKDLIDPKLWAMPGTKGHAVMWDMASPIRVAEFTAAAERCAVDITEGNLSHDGDTRLVTHVRNARRHPNQWGVSLAKENRESARKIDLAVCMVGAREVRRRVLNVAPATKRTGKVW